MTATAITRADPAGLRTLYDTARARGSGDGDRGMTEMSAEVLVSNHAGDDLRTAADRLVFPRAIEMLRNCEGLPEDEAQQRAAHIALHAAMRAQALLDDEGARAGAVRAQRQLLRRPPATTEMAAEDVDPEESILILKRRSLNVMAANQPESVIAGFATRRTTTRLSSAGGTGKTCRLTQAAIKSSQDRPVWGNADFHSDGPRRWLYMNAEDSLQSIGYWLARILARYDLQECPVDIMPVCETKTGEFLFSSDNAQSLARRINAERYDGLIIDTGIAVMTPGTRFIDPLSIRGWLRSSVGILQRETQAAIIVAVHDNKAGQPVSGTADWLSFARLALHLETAGQSGRETTLTLTTIKANLRWPYKKITLVLNPHSLTATVAVIERVGGLDATPSTPQDVNALLTKIVRNQIIPLPSEERTARRVEALVYEKARNSRIKRQTVRDFLDNHVVFEERPFGRTRGMVAVGIRDYAEETP